MRFITNLKSSDDSLHYGDFPVKLLTPHIRRVQQKSQIKQVSGASWQHSLSGLCIGRNQVKFSILHEVDAAALLKRKAKYFTSLLAPVSVVLRVFNSPWTGH